MIEQSFLVYPVGWVESPLTDRADAPRQGHEGAPPARIVFGPEFREAAIGLQVGDEVLVLTWLHLGSRDVRSVHPRGDTNRPITPDKPEPAMKSARRDASESRCSDPANRVDLGQ